MPVRSRARIAIAPAWIRSLLRGSFKYVRHRTFLMTTVTIPRDQLVKILTDVEVLVADVEALVDQDAIARQRLATMRADPSVRRPEHELDERLADRGVELDQVDD